MSDMIDETTGAAQCGICGEWRDDPAGACSCGLVRDAYGWSDALGAAVVKMATDLGAWPTADLKALARNLARMAELATEAAARAVSELNDRGAL
jgi:hypothetical protein